MSGTSARWRKPTKPEGCKGCPLYDAPGPVLGEGREESLLLLLGEAPGPKELSSGRPFAGPSGSVLNIACSAAGVSRKAAWVTNAVKCMWKRFRKPTPREVEHCRRVFLDDELKNRNAVVALGDTALKALIRDAGKISEVRGFVLETEDDST